MQQAKTMPFARLKQVLCLCVAAGVLAACSTTPEPKAKFSPKKYGVKASPKVVSTGPVPKGGGRYLVGKKYKIAGKWYYPKEDPNYSKVGLASWYGPTFHGRKTANGEVFDREGLTAAHTTMPLPSYARVTNLQNGRSMIVRVNDRGPFHGNRVIDLSERVATLLGTKNGGVAKVKVDYVGPARMDGHDQAYLMASLTGPGAVQPGASRPGTMIASAEPPAPVQPVSFGAVPAPSARPYDVPVAVASAQNPSISGTLVASFDPAIAYEANAATVQVASANTFTPSVPSTSATSYAPTSQGTANGPQILGVLPVSSTSGSNLSSGSAVSSFAAGKRISAAYEAVSMVGGTSVSLRKLALASSDQK